MKTRDRPDLPPALADMREQFRVAAARELAIEREVQRRLRTRSRRFRRPQLVAAVIASVLLLAGMAVAGGWLEDDRPLAPDRVPRGLQPAAGAGVVASSAVADPDGGLPWALRVFSNDRGQECVVVGRLRDGVLGVLRGGSFRALPHRVPGACGDLAREPLLAAREHRSQPPRTVIYGLSRGRGQVELRLDGRVTRVPVGALGTYLHVTRGRVGRSEASVGAQVDGRRVVQRLG